MDSGDLLCKAAGALEATPTQDMWHDLVSRLGCALGVDWVVVARLVPDTEMKLRTLAAWHRGRRVRNFVYEIPSSVEDGPLEDLYVCVRDAREHLQSAWLKQTRTETFGQIKLIGSIGQTLGILAVAHSRPLENAQNIESLLRIFAFKATVELEREIADEHLYCEMLETVRPGTRH